MKHRSRNPLFVAGGPMLAGLLLVSTVSVEDAKASPQATPSAQGTVASASAQHQPTTVLVPQNQVTYKTVYDVETVQVPVTTTQTQYRTEYRTQTVPHAPDAARHPHGDRADPRHDEPDAVPHRVPHPDRPGHPHGQRADPRHDEPDAIPHRVPHPDRPGHPHGQRAGPGHDEPDAIPHRVSHPDRPGHPHGGRGRQRAAHGHCLRAQAADGQPAGHQDGLYSRHHHPEAAARRDGAEARGANGVPAA